MRDTATTAPTEPLDSPSFPPVSFRQHSIYLEPINFPNAIASTSSYDTGVLVSHLLYRRVFSCHHSHSLSLSLSLSRLDAAFSGGPRYLTVTTQASDFLYFPSFWLHEVGPSSRQDAALA